MKSKFNLTIALLVLSTMLVSAAGAEYTRQFRKAWTKNSVTALKITNKFGEVKINNAGGDSVTIKVVVTVDNTSSARAEELLDRINIEFQKTGGLVSAVTEIEENFRGKQSFSIDYLINVPKDRELDISNSFGDVIIGDLDAKGLFDVSYGSLAAGKLNAPSGGVVKIIVKFGKADLATINNGNLEIKFSKLYAEEISQLKLYSEFSTIDLDKTANITLDSKHDGITIDEIGNLKSTSKFSNYKIDKLLGSLDLKTEYGSIRIDKVDAKFNNINIVNTFGGINIGLNGLNYRLQAKCEFCDINFPQDRFKGNKIKEMNRFSLDGNVGTGGGTVSINSRHGGIKLAE
jgi:hypothetical protein